MVPSWLQRELWKVYVEGQEIRKVATPIYLIVQTRCRLAIATAENHPARAELEADLAEAIRRFAAPEHQNTATDAEIITMLDNELRKRSRR